MKLLKIAAFVTSALAAGQAQALTLECTLNPAGDNAFVITDTYMFDHDPATGDAIAADAVIQAVHGAPIKAKVSDATAKKLVLTWNLNLSNSSGQMTKMQYRASITLASYAVTITAVPGGGYNNNFEARGTCREV